MSRIKSLSVAIDGPAGAGKSTVSRLLAEKTGFQLLDTGAMYRAFAWLDIQNSYGPALANRIRTHDFNFDMTSGSMEVKCDGVDITTAIRSSEVTSHVSRVASNPDVRRIAVEFQKEFVEHELQNERSVILEGRDIGTVVIPNANLKFFLTADSQRRAERRALELGGDVNEIAQSIKTRDELDSNREVSPLIQAPDAILIDASNLNAEQVCNQMLDEIVKLNEV